MTHTNKNMVSLVIPVYNEEQNLKELNRRILVVFDSIDTDYEIIYVDDGSSDKSLDIIKKFSNRSEFINFISFYRNFGQHAAVMAGLKHARGDIILTLDADLQNPPEEIPKLIEKLEEGYEIVASKRIHRKDKLLRRILSFYMNKIISVLTGVKLSDYGCMMRAYKREIINKLLQYGEKSVYIPAFTCWLSSDVIEIPIRHDARKKGKTNYSLLKLLHQAFDLITAYTIFPIQMISLFGGILCFVGILLFCYLMYFRIFIGTPSSLTSFIAILILLSGIILFCLGVISEYLVRLYREIKKMPLYIIKNSNITNVNIEKHVIEKK